MSTARLKSRSFLAIFAGVVVPVAVVSVAFSADGAGKVRVRPGQWDTTSQIWIDGKHVLRGPESAADSAMREAHALARAQMSEAERETLDRLMPPSNSIARATQCITPAAPSIDTRAALGEALHSLHASPWSCTCSNEQPSSRGYFLEYSCTTPAGGRAEGNARAMVNGDGAYTLALEGRAHAIDAVSGRPLDTRMVETRVTGDGVWKAEQCAGVSAAAADDAGEDGRLHEVPKHVQADGVP